MGHGCCRTEKAGVGSMRYFSLMEREEEDVGKREKVNWILYRDKTIHWGRGPKLKTNRF